MRRRRQPAQRLRRTGSGAHFGSLAGSLAGGAGGGTEPPCVAVTAYPNPDGTGTPQASAAVVANITGNATTVVNVDPASTIARIALNPASATVAPDGMVQIVATALDAQGRLVLTAPGK